MNTLSVQWGTTQRSIALLNSEIEFPIGISFSKKEEVQLANEIHKLLLEHDLSPSSISRVVLNRGPGSYTGIRIALATIQGFCAGSESEDLIITVVDSHDVILSKLSKDQNIQIKEGSCIASYAQRGEVLINKINRSPQNDEIMMSPKKELVPLQELCERLNEQDGMIYGCDLERWIPDSVLVNLTLGAADMMDCHGKNYTKENFHTVEPYYVRPQEFVKSDPARFRAK